MYNIDNGNPYRHDEAESIRIPDGMSVYAYEHDNGGGIKSNCLVGNVSSFGSNLNNDVSSVEIFDNTNCTRPDITAPTGQMVLPEEFSTRNGDVINIEVDASDSQSGIRYVEFFAWSTATWSSKNWIPIGTDSTAPYSIPWYVDSIEDSYIYVSAELVDNAGNNSGLLWEDGNWTSFTLDNTSYLTSSYLNGKLL